MSRLILVLLAAFGVGAGLGYLTGGEEVAAEVVPSDLAGLDSAGLAQEIRKLTYEPDPVVQRRLTASIASAMRESNVGGALNGLTDHLGQLDECRIVPIMSAAARINPEAAFHTSMSWPIWSKRVQGGGEVVRALAVSGNVEQAHELLRTISVPKTVSGAIGHALAGWTAAGELDAATTYLSRLPAAAEIDGMIDELLRVLYLDSGADAIMGWVDVLADRVRPTVRKLAFAKGLNWVANDNPVVASQWLMKYEDQPGYQAGVTSVAMHWIERDPQAMTEWLLSMPPSKGRNLALGRASEKLFEADVERSVAWVRSIGGKPETDPAVRFISKAIAPTDPAVSLSIAALLSTEIDRNRAYFRTLLGWQSREPEAAKNWLGSHEVPESIRISLAKRAAERALKTNGEPTSSDNKS